MQNLSKTYIQNNIKYIKYLDGRITASTGTVSISSNENYELIVNGFNQILSVSVVSVHPNSLQYFKTSVDGARVQVSLASAISYGHSSRIKVDGLWK